MIHEQDAFFRIVPKLRYLDRSVASPDELEQQARENEEDIRRFSGEKVKFGAAIQLQHCASGMYVAVQKQHSGKFAVLQDSPGDAAHFFVMPAFTTENVGDAVRITNTVQFVSVVFEDARIHVASNGKVAASNTEVRSKFTIDCVSSLESESVGSAVKSSSHITFYDGR